MRERELLPHMTAFVAVDIYAVLDGDWSPWWLLLIPVVAIAVAWVEVVCAKEFITIGLSKRYVIRAPKGWSYAEVVPVDYRLESSRREETLLGYHRVTMVFSGRKRV